MQINIAKAQPEDARGVQEIFYNTWLATYPNEEYGITKEDIENRFKDAFTDQEIKERTEQLKNIPDGVSFFVAKDGQKVVGVCRIVLRGKVNQLQAIYVLPEYQGKGIGKMFWKEAKKIFDPQKDTIVEVATYNTNAIAFYKKLGFLDTGERFTEERHRFKSGAIIPEMRMIITI